MQRIVATAKITAASAEFLLGHPRAASHALDPLVKGTHPGAAQAFQALARTHGRDTSRVDQLAEVGMLAVRARALGKGDRRIERIAYDDSVERLDAPGRPILVRWWARLLRPKAPDEPWTFDPDQPPRLP